MLTVAIAAWLAAVALFGLTVLLLIQARSGRKARALELAHHSGVAAYIAMCSSACLAGVAGAPPVFAAILAALLALAVVCQIWRDARRPKRTVWNALGDAWTAVWMALMDLWNRLRERRQEDDPAPPALRGLPSLDAAPGRTPPNRRRAAPPPPSPDADPAPGPGRPRFAVVSAVIPPDHAAAHQRIAEFEPAGLPEYLEFMSREARGFAGYGEAFGSLADGLIHGPGVHPAALRATFDFADGFHEVTAGLQFAVKRTVDYFKGHMEWVEEGHDPTKDGHWTIRE